MTLPENDDSKHRMKGPDRGTKAQRTILRKQEYKLINALYLTESKSAPEHVFFPVVHPKSTRSHSVVAEAGESTHERWKKTPHRNLVLYKLKFKIIFLIIQESWSHTDIPSTRIMESLEIRMKI